MKFNLKQVQDKLSSFYTSGRYDTNNYFVRYQNKKVFLARLNNDDKLLYTETSPILGLDLGEQSFQLSYATFMKLKNKDAEIIKDTLKCSKVLIDLDIDTKDVELPDYYCVKTNIILNYDDFVDIYNKVRPFSAGYETNNVLGTIHFSTNEDKTLDVVATDGSRLALLTKVNNLISDNVSNYMLQTCDLKKLSKVLKTYKEGTVKLARLDDYTIIIITIGDDSYPIRSAGGQYPRYKTLIPLANKITYNVNANQLIEALNEIAPFTNERTRLVTIRFDHGWLTCHDDNGKMVKVEYDKAFEQQGDEYINDLCFNLDFILQAVKSFEPKLPLTFEGNGGLSPWLLKQGNHIHLLMPVQTKN